MKIIDFEKFDLKRVNRLVTVHLGKYALSKGYVFVDDKSKIFGYCTLKKKDNKTIKIDWIYAKKGYGTDFIQRVEKSLFKKYEKIVLNVSIDPNETKSKVMRRLNFYIKNDYRTYDIVFRKKHGPMLSMKKER